MINELALFQKLANSLLKAETENPIVPPISPQNLFEELSLKLEDGPASEEAFEKALEQLVLNTPRTATRLFFNQLFGGRNPKATLGDLLAVLLNNSMYTYKVAGPQVGVEKEILRKSAALLGYPSSSDGTFAPGGSMTNFMAMVMARDRIKKNIPQTGVTTKMIVYTSQASHYSIPKNASFIGVGREQVRYIETNNQGVMDTSLLENTIKKDIEAGHTPFFVNATAGTTVLGAFDAIEATAAVSSKYNIWLHVDGAYCGSVLFSKKYKHLIKGAHLADSFSYNAHKMLGTPLTCSIILTKHREALHESFSNDAAYLYQTDGDDFNLGKTSIQCGRRNDALKFWTLWKSVGTKGLETIVDHQFDLATTAREYVKNNPNYTLYSFEDSISVCFNYKNISAERLCTALYNHSELLVGFGTFKETTFVRLVTINAGNTHQQITDFFKVLENFVATHNHLFETNTELSSH